jgi:hypothetical protein
MSRFTPLLALALATGLAACESSDPFEPATPTASLTVDAANGFAYVDLNGSTAQRVTPADPAASDVWELGFSVTSVVLNNGTTGPGAVVGYCVCQNAGATDAQVMAFSAANQLATFESVTAANIPTQASEWSADVFTNQRWYRYNLTGSDHQVWPTFNVYLIRVGADVYKVQLTNYYGPGGEPRQISFRYARLNT